MPDSSEKKRTFYRRLDVYVLVVIVIAAIVWLFLLRQSGEAAETVAIVYIDNKEVARIDLIASAPQDFVFAERPAVKLHRDEEGKIAFVESDCPDRVCIDTGKIHLPYQDAACLPNMMVVSVVSRDKLETGEANELDLVR